MLQKVSLVALCAVAVVSLAGCNSGSSSTASATPTNQVVQFQLMGSQHINTAVGATRQVALLVSSSQSLDGFGIDNLAAELNAHPGWSLASGFNCPHLDAKNPCLLNLIFAPSSLQHSGEIKLHYHYANGGNGSALLGYHATSANNIVASANPAAPIKELVGLGQGVTISFVPDNNSAATNLQLTAGLANLSKTNPGWSGPTSFSCANIQKPCNLTLNYTPTSATQTGTLALNYSYTNSAGSVVSESLAIAYQPMNWGSNYTPTGMQYMTATTVAALDQKLSGIYPVVESSLSIYLASDSALGYLGPLSSFGPLGDLGPLGSDSWDPTSWIFINGPYSWSSYFKLINGPLSAAGPLGENGPYSESAYYNGTIFVSNAFAANTRGFGLWSILGPIGPLGAVGPLGPLGPIGATGLARSPTTGQSINALGQVVRQESVPYSATSSRIFNVYENYVQSFAEQMPDNDTSFMVQATLGFSSSNSYTINSSQDQIVTVLAVPVSTISSNIIYVGVYTTAGKLIALSNSDEYINYVEFTAPANTSYVIKITKAETSLSPLYNLYVTGSYSYLNQYYNTGSYIAK